MNDERFRDLCVGHLLSGLGPDERAELEAELARGGEARLHREVARVETDLRTLASPEARTISLSGTEARPGARARVFVDPLRGRALLFAYKLPILPPDSVYQPMILITSS